MLRETYSVFRDLGRVRAIARVLVRYGWGDIAKRLGRRSLIGWAGNALNSQATREIMLLPSEVRARLAMQELGPTFVKLGQLLSTRAELLPPRYLEALARLQDNVEPFAFEEVQRTVEEELGVRLSLDDYGTGGTSLEVNLEIAANNIRVAAEIATAWAGRP